MSETMQVKVPDIGDFDEVEVIEILVAEGDTIRAEQSLITVESDKASMEIPSPAAGVVERLLVKLGDRISEGTAIIDLRPSAAADAPAAEPAQPTAPAPPAAPADVSAAVAAPGPSAAPTAADAEAVAAPPAGTDERAREQAAFAEPPPRAPVAVSHGMPSPTASFEYDRTHIVKPHASPSVRKFARELGVDLAEVRGSGPKQRILREDVQGWVKSLVSGQRAPTQAAPAGDAGAALGLLPWPQVDFSKFGPIERKPRERLRRIAAANLHRNWVMIPHVTNHDEADITELEAFRQQLNREQGRDGTKVTLLAFLIKACVTVLKEFPEFNASLDGDDLVIKQYWHIGFAADTPNGLVVPVIRDADTKGILQLAREMSELAARAREGKLSPAEMQGSTFTISSLGGIGGTYFTPIINAPEVAILGVCRSAMRPTWNGDGFEPRLILPLSLSWDHRVVDGAAAARFNTRLVQLLGDFRRVLL